MRMYHPHELREIYLQWSMRDYPDGMTWCIDQIEDDDIKYIRFDRHKRELTHLRRVNEELLAACKASIEWFGKFYLDYSITFEGAPELVNQLQAAIASAEATDGD
jgi:hypothetical protein